MRHLKLCTIGISVLVRPYLWIHAFTNRLLSLFPNCMGITIQENRLAKKMHAYEWALLFLCRKKINKLIFSKRKFTVCLLLGYGCTAFYFYFSFTSFAAAAASSFLLFINLYKWWHNNDKTHEICCSWKFSNSFALHQLMHHNCAYDQCIPKNEWIFSAIVVSRLLLPLKL